MHLTAITPILNVRDIPASIRWFESLGWVRCWTYNDGGMMKNAADTDENGPANFAAVGSGEVEIFLCRGVQGGRDEPGRPILPDGGEDPESNGTWMTWWVRTPAEVDQAHALALKHGHTVIWPPTSEPWGVRECRVRHPDGHVFRISAPLHL